MAFLVRKKMLIFCKDPISAVVFHEKSFLYGKNTRSAGCRYSPAFVIGIE